jgi:6-phosphofructo-2-kinase
VDGIDYFQDKNEVGPKLIIVMGMYAPITVTRIVGLPARGKSYIVRRVKRYLNWLGFHTKVFNVGNRRRKVGGAESDHSSNFFDPHNEDAKRLREQLALESLEEMIQWLRDGGKVGIHGTAFISG